MVKNRTKKTICNSWVLDSPRRMNSVTNVKFLLIISFMRYWPLHLYWITIKWKIDIAMSLMTFSSISFSFLLLCFDSCSFSVSTISTWQWNLVVFKASLSFLIWLSPLFFIFLFFISLLIVLLSLFFFIHFPLLCLCPGLFVWKNCFMSDPLRPMDCSLPGSSVCGIFQARILEWVAISFSRASSRPRDRTWVSCIVGRHFTIWATREAPFMGIAILKYHSQVCLCLYLII